MLPLSEDYEDELAERVRGQEHKHQWFWLYILPLFRSKPAVLEAAVLKLIFRNINPHMKTKLRGRVAAADELVGLVQQLWKDNASQSQYELLKIQVVRQKEKDRVDLLVPIMKEQYPPCGLPLEMQKQSCFIFLSVFKSVKETQPAYQYHPQESHRQPSQSADEHIRPLGNT